MTNSTIQRGLCSTALVMTLLLMPPVSAQAQDHLRTASEESGFERYTSHAEMMEYLAEVRASSTELRMGIYGHSWEGRELPYLIFSRPAVTRGWEAAALGRPVVELHANVHGGERHLRESLLILIRRLATPGTPENALLDHMVLVIAPQINPDGFEAQPQATRGNAWGIDMNRDYMKLEQPAVTQWVRNVLHEWNPHLWVDGHNGGQFPYNLLYQCPGHADPDQRITALCDEEIFPRVDAAVEGGGYHSFYWSSGNEERWSGGQTDARISRNYAGFANAIGILFESPGWQDLDDAVEAGILGFTAVLEYVRDHPDRVMETVHRARREAVELGSEPRGDVVVQMDVVPEDEPVSYLIGEGEGDDRRIVEVHDAPIYKKPVAVETRARPYAYLIPRDAQNAVDLLRRHNVTVEVLQDEVTLGVDAYVIEDVSYESIYNHEAATKLEVGEIVTLERSFPKGTFVVPTGQMLGRVVTHLLEPETNDNLIYWSAMDPWIPLARLQELQEGDGGEVSLEERPLVPVYKLMEARPLPARLLR